MVIEIDDKELFFDIAGEERCDEEKLLAILLDGVLFTNAFKNREGKYSTYVFVNANDIFAWGCTDAELLPHSEISNLYKLHKQFKYGSIKWCCIQRNMQPQAAIIDAIKEAGEWDDVFENLPKNEFN